jgi:DNA-binding PadR family transcriptional regulator
MFDLTSRRSSSKIWVDISSWIILIRLSGNQKAGAEMERRILLLGLLQGREMYGYQINEMIDTQIRPSLHLTKPTAYRLLHNLAEGGLITFREEKDGNRPTRRIYNLTPKGEKEFLEMLKESLSSFQPSENVNAIALAFLDILPVQEMTSLLETRETEIENTT